MNIPNLISAARILLVPLFVSYYLDGKVTAAMGVVLLAAASDVLDGAIARRFNMVTRLGKILDPVADKLMQAAMMLCAALETPAVWLLLGLHVLREAVLSLTGLHVILVTGQVHSAKWYGKLCTALIYACMGGAAALPADAGAHRLGAGAVLHRARLRLPGDVSGQLPAHPAGVRRGAQRLAVSPGPEAGAGRTAAPATVSAPLSAA